MKRLVDAKKIERPSNFLLMQDEEVELWYDQLALEWLHANLKARQSGERVGVAL